MKRALILTVAVLAGAIATVSIAAALGGGPSERPVNDRLDQATDLTFVELFASDRVDATLATAESNEPAHGGSPANASVWWEWTAGFDGPVTASSAGSDVPTTLAVYEGFPPTEVVTGNGTSGQGATLPFSAVDGETYLFAIDQKNSTGELEFTLGHAGTVPANDDLSDAIQLTGANATFSGNTALATAQNNEPDHGGEPSGNSIWWQWTAPSSGLAEITTCGSLIDTLLSVTTGSSVGGLVAVASNDDIEDVAATTCDSEAIGISQVEFAATAGQTYNIAVDGFASAAGPVEGTLVLDGSAVADGLILLSEPCEVATGTATPGTPSTVSVTGECGVPTGATAAVVSLQAIDPTGIGNLRLSAAGVAPQGGVVNYVNNGFDNANTITVPLSGNGAVDVAANNSAADYRLVAIGYYSTAAETLKYTPVTPCAVADSRAGQNPTGAFVGPFTAGANYPDIDVTGTFPASQGGNNTNCGVPNGASAVMINVVSIGGTGGQGGLAVGTGGTQPTIATTPFADIGLNNAASTIVPLNAAGTVATNIIADSGNPSTQLRIVVLGYFTPDSGQDYTPVNPCAAFDTRTIGNPTGVFAGKRVHATPTTYNVTGTIPAAQGGETDCLVPEDATAVLINLVGIQPDMIGNFRAYATGTTPTGGVLNFRNLTPSMNNSNAIVVPINTAGNLDIDVNAPNNPTDGIHARGIILGYYGTN